MQKLAGKSLTYRYRWFEEVPLRDGKQNLAMMFAALNMLAFAIPMVCDCLDQIWVDARTAKRARHRCFEHIRTITAYLVFPDWNNLMQPLIDSKPPPEIEAEIAR